MIQIASDGGLLPRPVARDLIPLQPAERVDVMVDFRQFGVGSKVILHNTAGEANTTAVMRFDVVGGGGKEEFRVPKRLRPLEKLPQANANRDLAADLPAGSPARRGRSTGAASASTGSTAGRGWARPSCGRSSTTP